MIMVMSYVVWRSVGEQTRERDRENGDFSQIIEIIPNSSPHPIQTEDNFPGSQVEKLHYDKH